MARKFVANPELLTRAGTKVNEDAVEFQRNLKEVKKFIQEMITSSYMDPAAREIAKKIDADINDLSTMTNVMVDYGTYFHSASATVMRNQSSIASNVRSGY